jgi:peptidoglycan/LPS O-acetylase OafA/YrhL
MVIMTLTGAGLAALQGIRVSVVAGVLTCYLVVTSALTVWRPPYSATAGRAVDTTLMLTAAATSVAGLVWGMMALQTPKMTLDGYPAAAYIMFGVVALIASVLDARMIHGGGVVGKHRIARHLWRIGFAMFVATSSFFLGQAKLFPDALKNVWLLATPVLLVIGTTLYWLVRTLLAKPRANFQGNLRRA